MQLNEIWKPVLGYEQSYEVSNIGNVRVVERVVTHRYGTATRKAKMMHPYQIKAGYMYVSLHQDGNFKSAKVHRLVAEAFLPMDETKPYVNHKDGVKNNNLLENLEWVSAKENTLHMFRVLGYKGSQYGKKGIEASGSIALAQIDLKDGLVNKFFTSGIEAAKEIGVTPVAISNCLVGKSKSCGGFKWAYLRLSRVLSKDLEREISTLEWLISSREDQQKAA